MNMQYLKNLWTDLRYVAGVPLGRVLVAWRTQRGWRRIYGASFDDPAPF